MNTKTIIKNTLILFAITLVAGILLGMVYEVTAEPRAAQALAQKEAGYKAAFSEAAAFEAVEDVDLDAVNKAISDRGIASDVAVAKEVAIAKDAGGNDIGRVITLISKKSYGGPIELIVGIKTDGTVLGYSILDISDTPGLGMKAKDEAFASQFRNKNVDHFEYTKAGATADNEIDALSGATITTRAIVNGMNAAIYAFEYLTGEGA